MNNDNNMQYPSLADIDAWEFKISDIPIGYSLSNNSKTIMVPENYSISSRGIRDSQRLYNRALQDSLHGVLPISLFSSEEYNGIEGSCMLCMTIQEVAEKCLAESLGMLEDFEEDYEY